MIRADRGRILVSVSFVWFAKGADDGERRLSPGAAGAETATTDAHGQRKRGNPRASSPGTLQRQRWRFWAWLLGKAWQWQRRSL